MSDHPPFKPSRRSAIAPFIVMEMMAAANARAASGAEVLHLEVGEPGGGTPPAAVEAAMAALARRRLRLHRGVRAASLRQRDRRALPRSTMA